ncbi:MAG: tyrosine-type recombinase/integrase [Pseudonocardia sp.]
MTRPVERNGRTRAAAMNNLRAALRDRRRTPAGGEITANSTLGAVALVWLRDLDESDRAIRTKITYRDVWARHVEPAVGALRLRDARVSRIDAVIRQLRERSGPGTAKHARVILSGLLGLAVRHDALDTNPVRDLTPARTKRTARPLVLIETSWAGLRKHLAGSDAAGKHDLRSLAEVLSGLGCRIGELLALDWPRVDDAAGTIAIEGTVVRVPGKGLFVQPHTKSDAGMRTIEPPAWVIDLLRKRHVDSHGPWVFPSTRGTLRDPDNTRKALRQVVAGTEWEGLHPHAFRHLVATRLDAAGLTAREIADYLGHERVSMTQDVYMSRKSAGTNAGAALDALGPESTG